MKTLCALFPGQGTHGLKSGKTLYEDFPTARRIYDEADEILGFSLSRVSFEGTEQEILSTANIQPAILVHSYAAFRVLSEKMDLHIGYAAGHSLGEYSALTCAGALDFADAVKLTRFRGQLMEAVAANNEGEMCVVEKVPLSVVEKICRELTTEADQTSIACYNSPNQHVISGHRLSIQSIVKGLEKYNARVTKLNVNVPFHSPLLKGMMEEFNSYLQNQRFTDPKFPVLSNVTARPHGSAREIRELLLRQVQEPVRWEETMQFLSKIDAGLALQPGPGKVLKNLTRANAPWVKAIAVGETSDIAKAVTKINEFFPKISFVGKCLANAVATKNRAVDEQQYEQGVIRPYRKIKKQHISNLENSREATEEEKIQALDMLISVFRTKNLPLQEQKHRIDNLLALTNESQKVQTYAGELIAKSSLSQKENVL